MTHLLDGVLLERVALGTILTISEEHAAVIKAPIETRAPAGATKTELAETSEALFEPTITTAFCAFILARELGQFDGLEGDYGAGELDRVLKVLVLARRYLIVGESRQPTALEATCEQMAFPKYAHIHIHIMNL